VLGKEDNPTKKLSPSQKLVLLALADNADDQGYCWPSIATIAKKCCLTPRSVYQQIAALERQHLLKRQAKHGPSNDYWVLPEDSNARTARPERRFRVRPVEEMNNPHTSPEPSAVAPVNQAHPPPAPGSSKPSLQPSVDPSKEESPPNPRNGGIGGNSSLSIEQQVENIYSAHPRQMNRNKALREIGKAIDKVGYEILLERTKLYARIVRACNIENQYVVNAASFYRNERYDDNPQAWIKEKDVKPAIAILKGRIKDHAATFDKEYATFEDRTHLRELKRDLALLEDQLLDAALPTHAQHEEPPH
jgi:hypothetical protein